MIGILFAIFFFYPALVNNALAQDAVINVLDPLPVKTDAEFNIELDKILKLENNKKYTEYLTQQENELYHETGYVIREIQPNSNIETHLKNNDLYFEPLKEFPVQIDETSIYINNASSTGFQISLESKNDLIGNGTFIIPQTECNKDNFCSLRKANLWDESSSAGWGFNVSGEKASDDFLTPDFYRPIPQTGQVLIAKTNFNDNIENIKLKIRIVFPDAPDTIFKSKLLITTLPY